MKAVVYTNPGTVKVQEIPIPETLPDEIKVKIASVFSVLKS